MDFFSKSELYILSDHLLCLLIMFHIANEVS